MRDTPVREGDGDAAGRKVALEAAAGVDSAEVPKERNVLMFASGEMGGGNLEPDSFAGSDLLDGRGINGKSVAFVDDARIVTEGFFGAVVVEEAIVLPF